MVRLTSLLRFRATPQLKLHEFGPEMPKIVTAIAGFDKRTFKHNWSLGPLFICSIMGGIVAGRYVWRLIRPYSNTENYQEPQIFCLKPYVGEKWPPLLPTIKNE